MHLLQQAGYKTQKLCLETKTTEDYNKKVKEKVNKQAETDFDVNSCEAYRRLNSILRLNDEQLQEFKDFFLKPNLVYEHFSICKYFIDYKKKEHLVYHIMQKQDFDFNKIRSNDSKMICQ